MGTPRIEIVQGDITTQDVDVVVNAANSSLLGGGGVDGAIHAAAGPGLLAECRRVRESDYPDGLPTGHAVITGAGRMPARHVVHTVGPNRHAGQTDRRCSSRVSGTRFASPTTPGAAPSLFPPSALACTAGTSTRWRASPSRLCALPTPTTWNSSGSSFSTSARRTPSNARQPERHDDRGIVDLAAQ